MLTPTASRILGRVPLPLAPLLVLAAAPACGSNETTAAGDPEVDLGVEVEADQRRGTEMEVCGRFFEVGVPVVLWHDDGGYDAYREGPFFSDEGPDGLRYRPGRAVADPALQARVDARGFELEELQEVVDLFVLHYDVCGTSRECFRILQDVRKLSVHFLLDVDGTIYQTLDLADQGWHARHANPRSVGVEIAQIGSRAPGSDEVLWQWYSEEPEGTRVVLPEHLVGDLRTEGFVGRTAREGLFEGVINDKPQVQFDFTPEQYESLEALGAALATVFPNMTVEVPRGADGEVWPRALTREEFDANAGFIGHWHVSEDKVDPGPAFQWDAYLEAVRSRIERD